MPLATRTPIGKRGGEQPWSFVTRRNATATATAKDPPDLRGWPFLSDSLPYGADFALCAAQLIPGSAANCLTTVNTAANNARSAALTAISLSWIAASHVPMPGKRCDDGGYRRAGGRANVTCQQMVDADTAALSGGAVTVEPASAWTGEAQWSASSYVSSPAGSQLSWQVPASDQARLVQPVAYLVDDSAAAPGALLPVTLPGALPAGATAITGTTVGGTGLPPHGVDAAQ